jgi:hypothetical protein
MSFDESFGDAGRLVFAGEEVLDFVVRKEGQVAFVMTSESQEKWCVIRSDRLSPLSSAQLESATSACQAENWTVSLGAKRLNIHSVRSGVVVASIERVDVEFVRCSFVRANAFAVVARVFDAEGWNLRVYQVELKGQTWSMQPSFAAMDATLNTTILGFSRQSDGKMFATGWMPNARAGAAAVAGVTSAPLKVLPKLLMAMDSAPLWEEESEMVIVGQAFVGGFVSARGMVHLEPRVNAFRHVAVLPQKRLLVVGDKENRIIGEREELFGEKISLLQKSCCSMKSWRWRHICGERLEIPRTRWKRGRLELTRSCVWSSLETDGCDTKPLCCECWLLGSSSAAWAASVCAMEQIVCCKAWNLFCCPV